MVQGDLIIGISNPWTLCMGVQQLWLATLFHCMYWVNYYVSKSYFLLLVLDHPTFSFKTICLKQWTSRESGKAYWIYSISNVLEISHFYRSYFKGSQQNVVDMHSYASKLFPVLIIFISALHSSCHFDVHFRVNIRFGFFILVIMAMHVVESGQYVLTWCWQYR